MTAFLTPIILCGGIGDRLKPISTPSYPKQFLSMAGAASLMEVTCMRVERLCPLTPPCILTTAALEPLARQQAPDRARFIIEPLRRNTGAAIAFAAQSVPPDAIVWIMPCDHIITREDILLAALQQATAVAHAGHIVLFGIKPDSAHTGYGYIHLGLGEQVESFTEKPDADTAQAYLVTGRYVWNSGMIVARAQTLINEFARLAPDYIAGDADSRYPLLPPVPFDTLILERTDKTRVIVADLGWQDVGGEEHKPLFAAKS